MLSVTVLLLFASLLTGWLGFGVLSGNAARFAKLLCVVSLLGFVYRAYNGGVSW